LFNFALNYKKKIMKKLLLTLTLIGSLANAQSWNSQATGFADASRGISEIHIIDANTVWGLAFDGSGGGAVVQEFTRTTNGGTTWTPGIIEMGNALLEINSICPVNATTAWVSALIPADGNGVIYKTTDAGLTWNQQNATGFQTTGSSFLNGVYFFNANNGVSYGDPLGTEFEIYTSSNGGDSWSPVAAANMPNPASGEYGYNSEPVAAGGSFWFTTNKGKLYRTTDMGVTWLKLNTPITDFGHQGTTSSGRIIFSDANNGILIGYTWSNSSTTATLTSTKLYTTTNGGTTWSAGVTYTGFSLLSYIPGTSIIVATSANTTTGTGTAVSTNNGVTWTTVESAIAQRGVNAFINPTTGWCGGYSADPFTDGIYKFSGALANVDFSKNNFLKVYPNPANNNITVSVNNVDSYKLKMIDMLGKVIFEKQYSGMENTIDISNLNSGAYFLTFISDDKSETTKIIKN
jgi:hypothetical protein